MVQMVFCRYQFSGADGVLQVVIQWCRWCFADINSVVQMGFCRYQFSGADGVLQISIQWYRWCFAGSDSVVQMVFAGIESVIRWCFGCVNDGVVMPVVLYGKRVWCWGKNETWLTWNEDDEE